MKTKDYIEKISSLSFFQLQLEESQIVFDEHIFSYYINIVYYLIHNVRFKKEYIIVIKLTFTRTIFPAVQSIKNTPPPHPFFSHVELAFDSFQLCNIEYLNKTRIRVIV
jgi:hypothetical protein